MTKKCSSTQKTPLKKYHQKSYNSYYLSILVSAFHCYGYKRAVSSIVNFIEESLTLPKKIKNRIHFANAIMKIIWKIQGEQNLWYNLMLRKKNDAFVILNDISEDITLEQLMDSLYWGIG